MAKTKTVQFSTNHKFSSSQTVQSYSNPSINITKILRYLFTNITTNDTYDLIQNKSLIGHQNIQLELNQIINAAKKLTKFEEIIMPCSNFSLFSSFIDNTMTVLIIIGIIICILIFRK